VTICLSSKRLVPYVKTTFTRKAPPFAKITDIEQLIAKHYGTVYSDLEKYRTEVLEPESSCEVPGSLYKEF